MWCVRRVLSSLAGLNSDFFFGLALQNGKQMFFSGIPQMTKYFVMRESVRIFLHGYLYAVTWHLITRRNFLFLNSLKGFQRSLAEISYFHFDDDFNHLKDLVICILWTLVMSFSFSQ